MQQSDPIEAIGVLRRELPALVLPFVLWRSLARREKPEIISDGALSAVLWRAARDAMPRFYLHVHGNRRTMNHDDVGLKYPDVETAWSAVVQAAQTLKLVFASHGHDSRNYAIEVENEAGEVVFRLPFTDILRPSFPRPHATYKLVGSQLGWLIYCDDEFVGGSPRRTSAESLVWEMVEARCAEHKASQVLIEDEPGCEKRLCRCFKEAPSETRLA